MLRRSLYSRWHGDLDCAHAIVSARPVFEHPDLDQSDPKILALSGFD
jgi:hypothetical protein